LEGEDEDGEGDGEDIELATEASPKKAGPREDTPLRPSKDTPLHLTVEPDGILVTPAQVEKKAGVKPGMHTQSDVQSPVYLHPDGPGALVVALRMAVCNRDGGIITLNEGRYGVAGDQLDNFWIRGRLQVRGPQTEGKLPGQEGDAEVVGMWHFDEGGGAGSLHGLRCWYVSSGIPSTMAKVSDQNPTFCNPSSGQQSWLAPLLCKSSTFVAQNTID